MPFLVYLQQWTLLFKVVIVLHRLAVEGSMDADSGQKPECIVIKGAV